MPSSMFGRTGLMRKPPCILHPPPPPDPVPTPGAYPLQLSGMARWTQQIGPLAADLAAYIDLQQIDPAPVWLGRSATSEPYLELSVSPALLTDWWEVHLSIHAPPIWYYAYVWQPLWIDPAKPYDTGLLTHDLPLGAGQLIARIML